MNWKFYLSFSLLGLIFFLTIYPLYRFCALLSLDFFFRNSKKNKFWHFCSFLFPSLKAVEIKQDPKIYEKYTVLRDGARVRSNLIYNPKSKYFFITVHGLNGNIYDFFNFSKFAQKKGYSCLTWNFREWNSDKESTCKYHLNSLVNDIYDLIKAVQKQFPRQKIILFGYSLGAMLLTELIYKYPKLDTKVRLVLINYPTKKKMRLEHFFKFNSKGIFKLLKAFLFNKNFPLQILPQSSENEIVLSDDKSFVSQNSEFPFYFFLSMFMLVSKVISNLESDKKHQILISLAANEMFAEKKYIESHQIRLKKHNSNISFWIRFESKHHFPLVSEKREYFFNELISRIIKK